MPSALVLGAGQVGTFAARAIAEEGARVVAADLAPTPPYFARYGPRDGATLATADVLDPTAIGSLMTAHAVDAVVLAAGPTGAASARDGEAAWRTHVEGAEVVARAALGAGVRRLVVVGSVAAYGRPAVDRVAETAPIRPRSAYGRMKAAAERALGPFRDRGLEVRILRACGVYGPLPPGCGSHSARFIEAVLLSALSGRPVAIAASRTAADEYLYVKDLGRAIAAAVLRETASPEWVFNVGPGRTTTARELGLAVQRVVPGARIVLETPAGDNGRRLAPLDVSRIRAALGFAPRYDLVAGLADYLHETGFLS